MKKICTLFFLVGISMLASIAKANSICFTDAFGYRWNITYSSDSKGHYSGAGTVDIGGGVIWNVNASAEFSNLSGTVELHAINPVPDGCYAYVDSLVYTGNAYVVKIGSSASWSGFGDWTNYCFGGVFNVGTWSATGPCGSGLKSNKVDANGPATHGSQISIAVSPNPTSNQTAISLKLAKQSQVPVTIYNYLQQPVRVLANGIQAEGKHSYVWDLKDLSGKNVSNGIYRVVAIVDGRSYSSTVQVVK